MRLNPCGATSGPAAKSIRVLYGLPSQGTVARTGPLRALHCNVGWESDTNRTGAEGLSFYYPQAAVVPESDAGSGVIKPASSFVIQNRQTSCSMWCPMYCIGHAVITWSAVCSEAPHSQFSEEARPHLCMDEWNRPTPVCRRLSLTQAARGKPIPTGMVPVPGTKART